MADLVLRGNLIDVYPGGIYEAYVGVDGKKIVEARAHG